jgi:hypothetical protein
LVWKWLSIAMYDMVRLTQVWKESNFRGHIGARVFHFFLERKALVRVSMIYSYQSHGCASVLRDVTNKSSLQHGAYGLYFRPYSILLSERILGNNGVPLIPSCL